MTNSDADFLHGADAIAKHLNVSRRQAYHMIENGGLPTFKLPGSRIVCARRSTLTTWLAEQEAKAREPGPPSGA